jgi:hypothetical protein
MALEDDKFKHIIAIYTTAAISNDHKNGIEDAVSYNAETKSPLAENCDPAIQEKFDAHGQQKVFRDLVELPEWRTAMPSYWEYRFKRNRAGNVKKLQGNLDIEGIKYKVTYALTSRVGHIRQALSITTKGNL